MKKKETILEAPVLNRSGYGTLSDDIFHALNTNAGLDIKVAPVNWGSCVPKTSIREQDKVILSKILKEPPKQLPELFVSVNIPHITAPKSNKFNINISCIVETSKAPDYLIDGLNKYQLSIVTSNFCKDVLFNSDKKPTIPVEVVYWGADTTTFKPDAEPQANVDAELAKIPEKEVFLYSGQITHPTLFKDRKDTDTLIKTFCEAFRNTPDVALVLKVNGTNFSFLDRDGVLDRIRTLQAMANSKTPVYLIHGELSEKEMAYLYAHKKVIGVLTFSHGESFGMSTLQGTLAAKPTFVTDCSANKEIVTEPLFLLEGAMQVIPNDVVSEFYPQGSSWFCVDTEKAKERLLDFYSNREPYNAAAVKLAAKNADFFSLEKLNYRLNKVINKYVK